MALRDIISGKTGIPESRIPGSYQLIGGIVLVKFSSVTAQADKVKIARGILESLKSVRSVYESRGISGEFREPDVIFLAGERNPTTLHKEHGISYMVDVSKVMFSKGNLFERQRVIGSIKPGETVVDMFSGIGYFSLGIAKFTDAAQVISIEKNPDSFSLLCRNIEINKITGITPVLGDCRDVSEMDDFRGIAERVMMGYLPGTSRFLTSAFRFIKEGGIIHYHDAVPEKDIWSGPEKEIRSHAASSGFEIEIIGKRKVKSFAPRKWHVAIDFRAFRKDHCR